MSQQLSILAELLSEKSTIEPQLILDVQGLPIFGAIKVTKIAKYGEDSIYFGQPNLVYGGIIEDENAKNYINISRSTNNITQQLFQDSGKANSVTTISINLIDKNNEMSYLVAPGKTIDDILSQRADVYLNFKGGAHPEDSIRIFSGMVDSVTAGAGSIDINVSHPESLKRQEIFQKIQSKLSANLFYRSKVIQGVLYKTRSQVTGGLVDITYIGGGSQGNEIVTVINRSITIQIQNGVTNAGNIIDAIENSQAATNLVAVSSDNQATTTVTMLSTILDSSTVVQLETTEGMLLPTADLTTYILIDTDLIRYTGISGNTLTGISFGQLDTLAEHHDAESETKTFYQLKGSMMDLALKLMLSDGPEYYNSATANSIQVINAQQFTNSIFFPMYDVQDQFGLVTGDMVRVTGATNIANNGNFTIISFGKIYGVSYLVVDAPLIDEPISTALVEFKSKYNVLPDGLAMSPEQVDVDQHQEINRQFSSKFFDYDFYLKDTVKADDFLSKQIYFPSGCYTLPRKGRASVGITLPPLAQLETKTIDNSVTKKTDQLKINRTINSNFYNAIVYRYNEDVLEDKFLAGIVTISNDSLNRIKNVKSKPLTIDAYGVRDTPQVTASLGITTKRYLDRYKFAAESISVEVLYKTGFNIDVGDTVIFGNSDMKIHDSTRGDRNFKPRLMEVVNKSMNVKTGDVKLDLLTTTYSLDGRYGTVSPSSMLDVGSTTTVLKLKTSFSTPNGFQENYKWQQYIGETIMIRNVDWTFVEERVLVGFSGANPNWMQLDAPLSIAPSSDFIVDAPNYPTSTDPDINQLWKLIHCFFTPQVQVVSGASQTVFDVPDSSLFFVGSFVRLHNEDFSIDSGDKSLIVTDITLNTITVSDLIGFIPDNTTLIDLIGFPDQGPAYRYI